ncbi:MAG: hypothetical protein Sylvanvirus9_4 [Sylvanvirus sp.]|uniref:Uncharacterized protein n=1 Tax=Sylvanvirus sp. TaxID=2487774 RepID=A0A3G5AJE4_9VIRU|nr:MAG: hypothetical protein Sylvanvirus9_4 [Sylvanvirus sp.]
MSYFKLFICIHYITCHHALRRGKRSGNFDDSINLVGFFLTLRKKKNYSKFCLYSSYNIISFYNLLHHLFNYIIIQTNMLRSVFRKGSGMFPKVSFCQFMSSSSYSHSISFLPIQVGKIVATSKSTPTILPFPIQHLVETQRSESSFLPFWVSDIIDTTRSEPDDSFPDCICSPPINKQPR